MKWIYKLDDPLIETMLGSCLIFIIIIILTRIIGLRSFAKFTAFDFAFTIAIGSIISSILTSSTTVVHGGIAIASLLVLTYIFSVLQKQFPVLKSLISNDPILLMDGDKILFDNMKKGRIDKSQLFAKLRESNVLDFNEIEAVVLESTGDISVLHKSSDEQTLNTKLLEGVKK